MCFVTFSSLSFKHQQRAKSEGRQLSIGKVIFRIYGLRMAGTGIVKLLGDFAGLVGPLCVSGIVVYATNAYHKTEPNVQVRF